MQKQCLIMGCLSFMALVLVLVWNGIPTKVGATTADHGLFTPGEVKWIDAPPSLPAGAKLAVLEGNPSEEGFFTMRLKFPDGYKIPPHWHSGVEHLTVISGTFNLGMGNRFDEKAGTVMPAGTFGFMSPQMKHFAWTSGGDGHTAPRGGAVDDHLCKSVG